MTKPETKPDSGANRFYITTPIYYVNARPHLGHAYSTIVCDAIARRKRAQGVDTWFLTGTDEHGQKIERSAAKAGKSPSEFATEVSAQFRSLWDRMGLTYDDFIRTTEERHKRGVQKLFRTLKEKGYIYKGTYTGQYCITDEAFVDVGPGAPCPDCGRITETVSEENYFFKLSAFERVLLELYEKHPEFIQPEARRNEVIAFVRSGLRDLSVSRSSFTWGIPVPDDEKHVIYVWMDALANYATAVGYGSDDPADKVKLEKFWPADIHLVGKEIIRFHCVYWPAFLLAAELPLPKSVIANGWLLFDKAKMSKSVGNIVRAETVLEVLGADALRYFLLREISFGHDGNFTFESLVQRYNADLANGYGNLVSRVVNMVHKYFGGVLPEIGPPGTPEISIQNDAALTVTEFEAQFDAHDFSRALETLWALVAAVDGYLTASAPWKKPVDITPEEHAKTQARVLSTAAEAIRIITALAYLVLPDSTAKVWQQIGLGDLSEAARRGDLKSLSWGGLKAGTRFGDPSPLFPRAEKDAVDRMQNLENQSSTPVSSSEAESNSPVVSEATAPPSETKVASIPAETLPSAPEPEPRSTSAAATPEVSTSSPEGVAHIPIDDFAKVDLRVAQILVAERIPKADKLLRLEVDLGYEKRQILAGIAQYYEPEKLIGRKVVIVANLAPRKMRGLESNGMVVAASVGDQGAPVLAGFLEDVPLGARLR
ncbi:methionine--tRNA ligase [Acidicapsa dinghuensis]|uniref:Methionine--tRNA ligase n=1 Tax=Acidicapsa dinghuensis TaxID=2218256 RepID=A0ABW1EI84_9BACT|nr:methionine--tRNA ligase [Acidicapsa dinghuensis]